MTLTRLEQADPGYRSPFVVDLLDASHASSAWLYHRNAFVATGSERHYEWMLDEVTLDIPEMASRPQPAASSVSPGYYSAMFIVCTMLAIVFVVLAACRDSWWAMAAYAAMSLAMYWEKKARGKRGCS